MSNSIDRIGQITCQVALYSAIATVVIVATPFVSLVAVPIFAAKSIPKWFEHRALYNRTITNLTREKFGRVPGQNYMRWDGKKNRFPAIKMTRADRLHEAMGQYPHGAPRDVRFNGEELPEGYPFTTKADYDWLELESQRRTSEDRLNSDLSMLRAFSKGLIPLIGVIWILFTETIPGGASQIGCAVCMMGSESEDSHWGWQEAIRFHMRNNLRLRRSEENLRLS